MNDFYDDEQQRTFLRAVPNDGLGGEHDQGHDGDLSADPADYSVAGDGSIVIQDGETLGHYAEWLGIRATALRRLNGLRYGRPVVIGQP